MENTGHKDTRWDNLFDIHINDIDREKVEFYAELIDLVIFGIQQQEGLEKIWME